MYQSQEGPDGDATAEGVWSFALSAMRSNAKVILQANGRVVDLWADLAKEVTTPGRVVAGRRPRGRRRSPASEVRRNPSNNNDTAARGVVVRFERRNVAPERLDYNRKGSSHAKGHMVDRRGARIPIGGFLGTLAEVPAPALGSTAIKAALERCGVAADKVDEVILGNVLGAGLGQNVARQAAIGAGLPVSVGATTVNKVCGSGMKAVMLAAQAIQCGDAEVVVAGGTENMSAAPYLLPKARTGYRLGHGELVDAVIKDGLWDVYNNLHMGTCGDRCAAK